VLENRFQLLIKFNQKNYFTNTADLLSNVHLLLYVLEAYVMQNIVKLQKKYHFTWRLNRSKIWMTCKIISQGMKIMLKSIGKYITT